MSAPIDAKTEAQICQLRRDNYPPRSDVWSILISVGSVSIHPPSPAEGKYISIPRAEFDAIVLWYLRDQKPLSKGSEG